MPIFDGKRAWFSANVPAAHISAWVADGGIQIRDIRKPAIQYYFSNALDDEETLELIRRQEKVVYKSAWITDSSLSRTRQPLGSYTLQGFRQLDRLLSSPVVERHTSMRGNHSPYARHSAVVDLQSQSPPANFYVSPRHMLQQPRQWRAARRDDISETQSMRSQSSMHSNTSSVLSSYGRRQRVVSRFVIHADQPTRNSIMSAAMDFTPNEHGFVAYKIPKLA
ncbi:hypothetical protein EC988_001396 [Linderina pennispora]|nr:hypothetical protein EC988_001396 [Linderina pennispora]